MSLQNYQLRLKNISKNRKKRGFGLVTVLEFLPTQLIGLKGVEFHGKPTLIPIAQ